MSCLAVTPECWNWGYSEHCCLQEWRDTKESTRCRSTCIHSWDCLLQFVADCAAKGHTYVNSGFSSLCMVCLQQCLMSHSEPQVLWTYLRTWFFFDISLISLDILNLFTMSASPRSEVQNICKWWMKHNIVGVGIYKSSPRTLSEYVEKCHLNFELVGSLHI